jgi:hypothetical protein
MNISGKAIFVGLTILLLIVQIEAQRRGRGKNKSRGRGRSKSDQCHQKEAEKCLNKMIDLGKGKDPTSIIATAAGIDRICKTVKDDTLRCFKNYFKKCGTPLHREISDLIIDTIAHRINSFCNDEQQKSTFLSQSPCFHKQVFSTEEHKTNCNNKFLSVVNQIETDKMNVDAIHSALCCGYNIWDDCTTKLITSNCGQNGQKVFRRFLSDSFGRITTLMCPLDVFPIDSQQCKKVKSTTTKNTKKLGSNAISKYILSLFSFLFVTEK